MSLDYVSNKLPKIRRTDVAYDGPVPKIEPTECKYCGKIYDDFNIYKGFCSFTCKARFNKKQNSKPKVDQYEEGDY